MTNNQILALYFGVPSVLFAVGLTIGVIVNNPVWLLLPIAVAPLIEIDRWSAKR